MAQRISNSAETRATAAVGMFLIRNPRFVASVLQLVFGSKIPDVFRPYDKLTVSCERPALGKKRMDLVIENGAAALVCEMKIGAKEDCGQYKSYRDYYLNRQKEAWVVGILNQSKLDALLDATAYKRITWTELWQNFVRFEKTSGLKLGKELEQLKESLEREGVHLGLELVTRAPRLFANVSSETYRDVCALPGNASAMVALFNEVISVWATEVKYTVMTTGNTPIYMRMGWKSWALKFRQPGCERLIIGLNYPPKRKVSAPEFYFQSEFFNRAFMNDFSAFQKTWSNCVPVFTKHGYEARGDAAGHASWARTTRFEGLCASKRPPKFCYMEHTAFSSNLSEREYLDLGWDGLVSELRHRIIVMKGHLDELVG